MKFFLTLLLFVVISGGCMPCFALSDTTTYNFPDSAFVVDSIKISGNEETKEFVILREMSLKPDSLITYQSVEYNKNRIYSLGLFNRVLIDIEPTSGERANLNINVHERWYIYPFPVFGLKDRDWSKLYYGAGLMHTNFRGRNEKLFGAFALGFDPWVAFSYRNPFLDETGSYFMDARFGYNKTRNKSIELEQQFGEFDEEQFSISATAGRRFGIAHILLANLAYRAVTIPHYLSNGVAMQGGTDRFPQLTLGYIFDTRDLAEYPSYGAFTSVSITKFNVPNSTSLDLSHINADFRKFIPVNGSFVLKGRAFGVYTLGTEPPSYEHVYFGYGERIRGHFKEVMEGENLFGVSVETHYMLVQPKYFTVKFLPKEFSVMRFALAAAAFADAGVTWYRHERVPLERMPSGYGLGLHFLVPFNIVLRTEYAWNENGKGEFIFDFGASF